MLRYKLRVAGKKMIAKIIEIVCEMSCKIQADEIDVLVF